MTLFFYNFKIEMNIFEFLNKRRKEEEDRCRILKGLERIILRYRCEILKEILGGIFGERHGV